MSTPVAVGTVARVLDEQVTSVPVTVYVHVESGSKLGVDLYPERNRAVLDVSGTNHASVHLFADAADLRRLYEVLGTAIADLAAQRADLGYATTAPAVGA